jgi:hypothetical protein
MVRVRDLRSLGVQFFFQGTGEDHVSQLGLLVTLELWAVEFHHVSVIAT